LKVEACPPVTNPIIRLQRLGGIENERSKTLFRQLLITLIAVSLFAPYVLAAQQSTEGLDMQAAARENDDVRGRKIAYTTKWELGGLPKYQPQQKVSGTISVFGAATTSPTASWGYWEAAFRKYHPDVKIDFPHEDPLAAVPQWSSGVSDLGIGRRSLLRAGDVRALFDRPPIEIELMTGSYDVPGWNPGFGIVVHKDNPLTQLTMKQLDGIFGAERAGGWEGTSWRPQAARGPEENIRTWGQLGLTGEWPKADQRLRFESALPPGNGDFRQTAQG